jgi:hypothetical protein
MKIRDFEVKIVLKFVIVLFESDILHIGDVLFSNVPGLGTARGSKH